MSDCAYNGGCFSAEAPKPEKKRVYTPLEVAVLQHNNVAVQNSIDKGVTQHELNKALLDVTRGAKYYTYSTKADDLTKIADIIELLIEAGADVNISELGGSNTALSYAIKAQAAKPVALLIEAGADVNAEFFIYNNTALQEAVGYCHKNEYTGSFIPLDYEQEKTKISIVKSLLAAGADTNKLSAYDLSPNEPRHIKCAQKATSSLIEQYKTDPITFVLKYNNDSSLALTAIERLSMQTNLVSTDREIEFVRDCLSALDPAQSDLVELCGLHNIQEIEVGNE